MERAVPWEHVPRAGTGAESRVGNELECPEEPGGGPGCAGRRWEHGGKRGSSGGKQRAEGWEPGTCCSRTSRTVQAQRCWLQFPPLAPASCMGLGFSSLPASPQHPKPKGCSCLHPRASPLPHRVPLSPSAHVPPVTAPSHPARQWGVHTEPPFWVFFPFSLPGVLPCVPPNPFTGGGDPQADLCHAWGG